MSGNNLYFTSTETFKYTSKSDGTKYTGCIYQVQFSAKNSAKTKGNWYVFSRPKDSVTTIEVVSKGEFEGSPFASGKIELTYENGTSAGTVDISGVVSGSDYTDLKFSMNVSSLHKVIGAVDEK